MRSRPNGWDGKPVDNLWSCYKVGLSERGDFIANRCRVFSYFLDSLQDVLRLEGALSKPHWQIRRLQTLLGFANSVLSKVEDGRG